MSTSRLDGAVVLVTGASGQVGWGIAKAAQAAGATLVLPTRRAEGLSELEREFAGSKTAVGVVDMLDEGELEAWVRGVVERFGRIDHVAAPLGAWWQKGATIAQPRRELRALLETYVEAQHVLVKAVAPSLRRSRGSYTFVTGAAGEHMVPGAGLLVAAVNAQFALSRVLRAELSDEPFRINEMRIACRVERDAREGVVPSVDAAQAFLEVMTGSERGAVLRFTGDRKVQRMPD